MKKEVLFLSFFLFIISNNMFAQIYDRVNIFADIPEYILMDMDKMGLDDSLYLTELEGEYFNALYRIDKRKINLYSKKIGFLTGSLGQVKSSKEYYFQLERNKFANNGAPNPSIIFWFDSKQKNESGGYDGAIVFWYKKFPTIKDVMKGLKKQP